LAASVEGRTFEPQRSVEPASGIAAGRTEEVRWIVSLPNVLCHSRRVEADVLASIKMAFDELVSVQRGQGWEPRRDELLRLASHMLNDARQFEEAKPLLEVAAAAALETAK
jgi:hypothetical protein